MTGSTSYASSIGWQPTPCATPVLAFLVPKHLALTTLAIPLTFQAWPEICNASCLFARPLSKGADLYEVQVPSVLYPEAS